MHRKFIFIMMVTTGIVLLLSAGLWLAAAQPVSAQCGSSASSCKNCHEVQGEMPVNNDDSAWHTSHAFGDFCYICHAGNQQVTDKGESHTGMVAPLSDIKASCMQCHPDDLQDRAQAYAKVLGVEIGSDGPVIDTNNPAANSATNDTQSLANAPVSTEMDVNDPNLVNYIQNYEQVVLGKFPTNWGNVILLVMIGFLVIGGGGFVIINENLVKVSFGETKTIEGEYPSEIVDMLPAIQRMNLKTRKSLKNILDNPKKTEEVLSLIDLVVSNKKSEE